MVQVCVIPEGVTPPDFDDAMVNGRYDMKLDDANNQRFFDEVKAKMLSMGYTGPLTGEILYFPIADGSAAYMVAEAPKKTILIHLPIGDVWNLPEWQLRGLTKAEIKRQVASRKRLNALFSKKGA